MKRLSSESQRWHSWRCQRCRFWGRHKRTRQRLRFRGCVRRRLWKHLRWRSWRSRSKSKPIVIRDRKSEHINQEYGTARIALSNPLAFVHSGAEHGTSNGKNVGWRIWKRRRQKWRHYLHSCSFQRWDGGSDDIPRTQWNLGRVEDKIPSTDHITRRYKIQMPDGRTFERHHNLLVPLENDSLNASIIAFWKCKAF